MTEKEILLTSILQCSRSALYTKKHALDSLQRQKLNDALALRAKGFPLQYILGEVEFLGLNFKVDRRALIPRPETELLVEEAIKRTEDKKAKIEVVLDLGTGSGCIAISVAKFLPQAVITALDISFDALRLAKENAMLHSVEHRIRFVQSDMLSAFSCQLFAYDLIVSNPPYVCSSDIQKLQTEVQYEPPGALDGGSDGLDFYRRIIKDVRTLLKKDGFLLMEIGFGQRKPIEGIIARQGGLELVEVRGDYSGIERVMVLKHG